MLDGQLILDADSHVMEPEGLWDTYLDPRFRARAPRRRILPAIAGAPPMPGPLEVGGELVHDRVTEELDARGQLHLMRHHREALQSGFGPASHVAALRRMGADLTFAYPTVGAWLFAIDALDIELSGALVRAYNDWLLDYCSHDPSFLRAVGVVNRHDPAQMVPELERIAGFGWKAVYLRPNPIQGRVLSHPDYEPFWSACERLGIAVAIHEGTHARVRTAGADRFDTRFAMHACSHPIEHMMAFLALVEGGVLERHPGLRVAFLEAGCGFLPYWLWRLDQEYAELGWEVKLRVKRKPSEYFRRQCFVSCEPGEPYLRWVVDQLGADNLLFGSDHPHMDHTPAALDELLRTNAGLDRGVLGKIFWENPARFYDIDARPAAAIAGAAASVVRGAPSVTVVKQALETYTRTGNPQALMDRMSDDVTLSLRSVPGTPLSDEYRGKAAVARYFATIAADFEWIADELIGLAEIGERVVILGRERVRVRRSGREFEGRTIFLYTVRDGAITAVEAFSSPEAILDAYSASAFSA
jgi:uncharacterized protein